LLRGPVGPLVVAGVAVLLSLGTAAPVLAGDPPTPPRAAPAPRGARTAPSGASYETVVALANDSARDLSALQEKAHQVAADRDEALGQMSALAALTERPSVVGNRIEREALRLSAGSPPPSAATIAAPVREATEELRSVRVELKQRFVALQADALALAPFAAMPTASGVWTTPAQGPVTQPFGPVRAWFEPARTYRGVFYPHFHEGIDIGGEIYSPVVAAAPGRVVWVGHVPDGAMIVLIAHVGGLVSLYAHLDDRTAPPRVSAGDEVHEGQIIGAMGMTGMTTGPHLHFVVWREGELVDPLSLFAH
jgi:murein DD-endopeptidase MepM/ murein hydrolase activator NlpD